SEVGGVPPASHVGFLRGGRPHAGQQHDAHARRCEQAEPDRPAYRFDPHEVTAADTPERSIAALSVPRYDATTTGSSRTLCASPAAMMRPCSSAMSRSESDAISGMSCSMTT